MGFSNFVVITGSGCHLIRRLEGIVGVNLRGYLAIKNQKLDISGKSFLGKEVKELIGKLLLRKETMPENTTSFVMTNIQDKISIIKKNLGNYYGLRTWVEYGFRQCKQELGWTDYRLTNFKDINKWWEIIMSAYLMISLNSLTCLSSLDSELANSETNKINVDFFNHPQWNQGNGWKNILNNFRLLIQPTLLLWLIDPWLRVFPNSSLLLGFPDLINLMNQFQPFYHFG